MFYTFLKEKMPSKLSLQTTKLNKIFVQIKSSSFRIIRCIIIIFTPTKTLHDRREGRVCVMKKYVVEGQLIFAGKHARKHRNALRPQAM